MKVRVSNFRSAMKFLSHFGYKVIVELGIFKIVPYSDNELIAKAVDISEIEALRELTIAQNSKEVIDYAKTKGFIVAKGL